MIVIEPIRNGQYIMDGAYALAVQVYVQEHLDISEPVLLPYIVGPTVQVGRFQNSLIEANEDYIKVHDILLVRRDTGGGTLYQDAGHVNFCFVYPGGTDIYGNYAKMYQPTIEALEKFGVKNLSQSGRNDLEIAGKKISGAAMTMKNNLVYGGFSLMLDVDYDAMVKALNPNEKKIISKGIQSVRARVTDIRSHLAPAYQDLTNFEFKDLMAAEYLGIEDMSQAKRYELTDQDWANIDQMVATKYKNWDWNFGNNPTYATTNDVRVPGIGTIEVSLEVVKGHIQKCRIYGDFFGKKDVTDIENMLIGQPLREDALISVLKEVDLTPYFGPIDSAVLINLILA
ncbi:lipoate--protein ligase [Aerococcaceae bacterium 50-4]